MFACRVPSGVATITSYAAVFRIVGSATKPRRESSETTWCTPAIPVRAVFGRGKSAPVWKVFGRCLTDRA